MGGVNDVYDFSEAYDGCEFLRVVACVTRDAFSVVHLRIFQLKSNYFFTCRWCACASEAFKVVQIRGVFWVVCMTLLISQWLLHT